MNREKLSAKMITSWLYINYGIFMLGFFVLGSLGTDKYIVWGKFPLKCFPCGGFACSEYIVVPKEVSDTSGTENPAFAGYFELGGLYLVRVFAA